MNLRRLVSAIAVLTGLTLAACGNSETVPGVSDQATTPSTLAPVIETSTIPAETTTVVPAPVTMSLAFAGDILIHSQVWKAATVNAGGSGYDFTPMFARVKPLIEGVDLAICHLEVPLVALGEKPTTNPLYSAPTELAWAIKGMGFDRCSTASNHSFDKGVKGIEATLNEFDALGLGQAGMARTPEEIEPKVFDVKGIKVTHLSYTFGFNDIPAPNGETWRSALIDPSRIIADAQKARDMGARVVIVTADITLNPDGSVQVAQPVAHPIWVDKYNGVVVRPVLTDLVDPTTSEETKAELAVSLERTRSVVGEFFPVAP